jgi:hypothetical protein
VELLALQGMGDLLGLHNTKFNEGKGIEKYP